MGVGVSWSGAGCCRVSEGTLASPPSQTCQSAPQGYDSDVGAGPGFAGQQLQGARHRQVTRPSPCQRIPGARASDGRGRRGRPGALLHLPPPGGGQRLLAGSRPPGPALPPLPRLLPVPFGALRFAKARRLLVANAVSKSTLYPFSHSKCFTLFCIFPLIEYSGDISLCKRLPYHILNGNIFF